MTKGPNPKIFIVLTAATVLAGSALAYMQYSAYNEISSDVEKLRAEARNEAEVQRDLEAAILRVNETRAQLTHLEQGVPEMAYVPTMLKELEVLGKQCGIDVTGVRPIPRPIAPPVKNTDGEQVTKRVKKPYVELAIEVKGRGGYGSVMKFIDGLTKFPKIVAAKTVSLQPRVAGNAGEAKTAPKLNVTLELRSYLFPTDKDKKKDEPAATGEKTIDLSSRKNWEVNTK